MRHRIGYVIQDGGLFPHLTSAQNVGLMAKHLQWPADRIRNRIEELAELTRLPRPALDRYPTQISEGQRQRVGIMRALMLDPPVMLLDEPMEGLAPIIVEMLLQALTRLIREEALTVVLVEQSAKLALQVTEDVLVLSRGRIIHSGKSADLLAQPELLAQLIVAH
jgi:osmoprotectant transport system ATP-binding protein